MFRFLSSYLSLTCHPENQLSEAKEVVRIFQANWLILSWKILSRFYRDQDDKLLSTVDAETPLNSGEESSGLRVKNQQ